MFFGKKKIKEETVKAPTLADSIDFDEYNNKYCEGIKFDKVDNNIVVYSNIYEEKELLHVVGMTYSLLEKITPVAVFVSIHCEFKHTGEYDLLWSTIVDICQHNHINLALATDFSSEENDFVDIKNVDEIKE